MDDFTFQGALGSSTIDIACNDLAMTKDLWLSKEATNPDHQSIVVEADLSQESFNGPFYQIFEPLRCNNKCKDE